VVGNELIENECVEFISNVKLRLISQPATDISAASLGSCGKLIVKFISSSSWSSVLWVECIECWVASIRGDDLLSVYGLTVDGEFSEAL
jgi:hypothetical protein